MAHVTRLAGAARRALRHPLRSEAVPLTLEDELALADKFDRDRGLDRPRNLRSKEGYEHLDGAPVLTWVAGSSGFRA